MSVAGDGRTLGWRSTEAGSVIDAVSRGGGGCGRVMLINMIRGNIKEWWMTHYVRTIACAYSTRCHTLSEIISRRHRSHDRLVVS